MRKEIFLWSSSLLIVNIKLDSLWTHLEAMSLLHQYKWILREALIFQYVQLIQDADSCCNNDNTTSREINHNEHATAQESFLHKEGDIYQCEGSLAKAVEGKETVPALRVHVAPFYDVVARGRRRLHGGARRVKALSHRLTLIVSRHTLAEQQTVRALRAHVHEEIL